MKNCIQCGKPIPDGASFCPYCTASQVARRTPAVPAAHRKGRRAALAFVAVLAVLAGVWLLCRPRPEKAPETAPEEQTAALPALPDSTAVTDGATYTYIAEGAEYPYYLRYTAADGVTYQLFTGFSLSPDGSPFPDGTWQRWMMGTGEDHSPISLYVVDGQGRTCPEEFRKLVKDISAEAVSQEDEHLVEVRPVDETCWAQIPGPAGALDYREVTMHIARGITVFRWTVEMENGDVMHLDQTVDIRLKQEVTYTAADTPLATAEDLQRLLDSLPNLGQPEAFRVVIRLPDAVYDKPVTVPFPVELRGTGEETVFTRTLTVQSGDDETRLQDLTFRGSGGTGVSAQAPTYLVKLSFTGWDVAAQAEDGGWLYPRDSTFRQNGVGLLYDSVRSESYGCLCAGNRFLDNTVAIRLENMIPGVWLEPEKCTFRGNGTDIDNRGDFTVNMVDCTVS